MDEVRAAVIRLVHRAVTPEGILDILLVWFVVYQALRLVQMSQTHHLRGLARTLVLLASCWILTRPEHGLLKLDTFNWLLTQAAPYALIAVVVVFQPEIRQSFGQLGSVSLFGRPATATRSVLVHLVNEVVEAAELLASRRVGALIAFERRDPLAEIVETGHALDSEVSAPLLETIFAPSTPLHDGAVVVRGDRVAAAACLLPLTERRNLAGGVGTRHRAALGLADRSDAVTVVVSEETGAISVAYSGELQRGLTGEDLKARLLELLVPAGGGLLAGADDAEGRA